MRRVAIPLSLTRQAAAPREGRKVKLGGPTMGVTWSLQALAPAAVPDPVIAAAVQGALNDVVAQMSTWEPQSDLSRFNRAAAGAWIAAPDHLMAVVKAALALAEQSDGAFDPTIGRLVDLWGFGAHGALEAIPAKAELDAAPAGWNRLEVEGHRLRQPGGLALDLSGIAKGFGVDLAARALADLGLRDFLLEVGGELRGSGVKANGEPWWVEIEPPPGARGDDEPILVALHGLSIASSGDWRRSFTAEGRRYSHTIDPHTRAPVDGGLAGVTVIHEQCMLADGLCTVLAVLGTDAPAFAARHDIAANLVFRDRDGLREETTPALAAMLA